LTLGWRCIDCNRSGTFIIPERAPITIQDCYDSICNQHLLATPFIILFAAPNPTTVRTDGARLILETTAGGKWADFEVRHVR